MFVFRLCVLFAMLAFAAPAYAQDCTDPDGTLGTIFYNLSFDVYQGCTKQGWIAFHKSGGHCPANGLVGHWKLDESGNVSTAADSAGTNDGALTNFPADPSANWTAGKIGNALDFDGTDDYVDAGSDTGIDDIFDGGGTVSVWVKASGYGEADNGRIVAKELWSGGAPYAGWLFYMRASNSGIAFLQRWATDGSHNAQFTAPMSLNTWHHVAVTYNSDAAANDAQFYIDGIPVTTTQVGSDPGTASRVSDAARNFLIGNTPETDRTFDGLIDDVRIYNRVLSATEISALYNGGAGCQ